MTNIFFHSTDNLQLKGCCWEIANPKAILAIVHGMGEHSARFNELSSFFNDNGLVVVAFDHRGHGMSEGKRGHTPSYDQLLSDVDQFLNFINGLYSNLPIFLMGHSMGGNIVLNYSLSKKHKCTGIIASSPWLRLAKLPPTWLVSIARIINKVYPKLTFNTDLDPNLISRDNEVVKQYIEDPMVHSKITSNFYLQVNNAGEKALHLANKNNIPTLVFHGSEDGLTSHLASIEFAERSPNTILKIWEGLYHETYNEPEKKEVLEFLLTWIKKLIK